MTTKKNDVMIKCDKTNTPWTMSQANLRGEYLIFNASGELVATAKDEGTARRIVARVNWYPSLSASMSVLISLIPRLAMTFRVARDYTGTVQGREVRLSSALAVAADARNDAAADDEGLPREEESVATKAARLEQEFARQPE